MGTIGVRCIATCPAADPDPAQGIVLEPLNPTTAGSPIHPFASSQRGQPHAETVKSPNRTSGSL